MTNLGPKRQSPVFYDLLDEVAVKAKFTAEETRAAALIVCQHATDVDDARELLAIVGLLPGEEGS